MNMATTWWLMGTGMHARKVAQALLAQGQTIAGFIDEAPRAVSPLPGLPVVSLQALPAANDGGSAFVAIGNEAARRRLMNTLQQRGWRLPAVVHPRAWVAPDAVLEEGVFVGAGAVVDAACRIGRGAIVDIGVLLDHECRVAPFVHLRAPGALGPRHASD